MIHDMLGNEFYAGAYKVPGQNQWTECSSVELKNRFLDLTGQKQGETCRVDEAGLMAHLRCPGLFLGQTVRKGNTKVQFSKEANNLCNLNSYNHSGYSLTNIEKYNEPDKLKDSDALSDWLFN
ncbi:hypothetical protein IGI04_041015 [Brassica rapa subsp. trilocularis]|uniref:Uncharacterized protein n=1 Tax=Brassica rapa subsp. trilocularis TaxID=1813537 RepID=A0ABQ7KPJ6_BRACM|nr:hypothetical protein IGI04_041015 [Brassica rapa subsp. trilocularis]